MGRISNVHQGGGLNYCNTNEYIKCNLFLKWEGVKPFYPPPPSSRSKPMMTNDLKFSGAPCERSHSTLRTKAAFTGYTLLSTYRMSANNAQTVDQMHSWYEVCNYISSSRYQSIFCANAILISIILLYAFYERMSSVKIECFAIFNERIYLS